MASSMSVEEAITSLREMRDNQERKSDEVLDVWENVLVDSNRLGEEAWLIYEQVYIAALDCGREDIAWACFAALKSKFPKSSRVTKLEAMKMEAEGSFDDAREIYEQLLEDDETNSLIRKRLISILKAENKIEEAIKELNKYLQVFVMDSDAWMELCDLYIQEQDYPKACYCMEELVLSNPQNHLFFQKFGEIKYTQKGIDNLEQSRGYFSQALKLCPGNMRALYGMLMASSSIVNQTKDKDKRTDNTKYSAWAAKQILEKYQEADLKCRSEKENKQLRIVQDTIKSLDISPS